MTKRAASRQRTFSMAGIRQADGDFAEAPITTTIREKRRGIHGVAPISSPEATRSPTCAAEASGGTVVTRMSTLFLRTLREDPADAELPSHRLLVRGGYIRRVAPGIFSWLPLGYLVYRNVERVVREEMDAIGSQEVHFPALLPREPYDESGRW